MAVSCGSFKFHSERCARTEKCFLNLGTIMAKDRMCCGRTLFVTIIEGKLIWKEKFLNGIWCVSICPCFAWVSGSPLFQIDDAWARVVEPNPSEL